MWDSETKLDYLNVVSGEKKKLLDKTCEAFTIPPKGVVIYFDLNNYQKSQNYSVWQERGFHENIELECLKSIPHEIKGKINDIINSKNYSHLIWISRKGWDTSEIDFVWLLAHELQHLKQDIENHDLSRAGTFLFNTLGTDEMDIEGQAIQTTVPTEMDAYLAAWRIVQCLFGKEKAESYVLNNTKNGYLKESFQQLHNHGLEKEYYVYSETINLLRKYQTQFDKIIEDNPWYYRKIGSIDSLCSKLKS